MHHFSLNITVQLYELISELEHRNIYHYFMTGILNNNPKPMIK